jgi:hypothetical protein
MYRRQRRIKDQHYTEVCFRIRSSDSSAVAPSGCVALVGGGGGGSGSITLVHLLINF